MTAKFGIKAVSFRNGRKKRRGVSPIIATILLVAITVVLAAVLYVLISGLTKTGASTPYELGMQETGSTGSGNSYTIFIAISPTTGLTTSAFGLKVVTVSGTTAAVGTVPTSCGPKATLAAPQAACIGVTTGWYALLLNSQGYLAGVFGTNSSITWNYGLSGATTVPLNGGYTVQIISYTSITGIGDTMQAYGLGTSSVSGQATL